MNTLSKSLSQERIHRLIILEHFEDIESIIRFYDENTLVVAFSIGLVEILQAKGINAIAVTEFYDQEELLREYPEVQAIVERVCYRLNEMLLNQGLINNNLNYGLIWFYSFKCLIDQVWFYCFALDRIFNQFKFDVCFIKEKEKVKIVDGTLMPSSPCLTLLVVDLACLFQFKLIYFKSNCSNRKEIDVKLNEKKRLIVVYVKRVLYKIIFLKNQLREILFRFFLDGFFKSRISIAVFDSHEINSFSEKSKFHFKIINFPALGKVIEKQMNIDCRGIIEGLVSALISEKHFPWFFSKTVLIEVFSVFILEVLQKREVYEKGFLQYKTIIEKERPELILNHTCVSFSPETSICQQLASAMNIPYAIWMHGGYGANFYFPGYVASDFKFSNIHFVYGQVVADCVNSKNSILRSLYPYKKYQIHVFGSPYHHQSFLKFKKSTKIKKQKKRITLALSNIHDHNSYYLGFDKNHDYFRNWSEHLAIIRLLSEYQEEYEIIIKDYPNSTKKEMWREAIKLFGGAGIKYITNDVNYMDLVINSDLLIFTWVSTSLFQGLLCEADIFLLDDTPMFDTVYQKLKDNVFFSDSTKIFLSMLKKYLDEGRFYQKKKIELKNYFIEMLSDSEMKKRFEFVIYSARNHSIDLNPMKIL